MSGRESVRGDQHWVVDPGEKNVQKVDPRVKGVLGKMSLLCLCQICFLTSYRMPAVSYAILHDAYPVIIQ